MANSIFMLLIISQVKSFMSNKKLMFPVWVSLSYHHNFEAEPPCRVKTVGP